MAAVTTLLASRCSGSARNSNCLRLAMRFNSKLIRQLNHCKRTAAGIVVAHVFLLYFISRKATRRGGSVVQQFANKSFYCHLFRFSAVLLGFRFELRSREGREHDVKHDSSNMPDEVSVLQRNQRIFPRHRLRFTRSKTKKWLLILQTHITTVCMRVVSTWKGITK